MQYKYMEKQGFFNKKVNKTSKFPKKVILCSGEGDGILLKGLKRLIFIYSSAVYQACVYTIKRADVLGYE